jgi:DNA-binding CsgD family transcriptional regulator
MRLDEFITGIVDEENPEEIFKHLQEAAAQHGYDQIMYRALRNHPDTQLPCVARTYPDEWIHHYVEAGYVDADPVRLHMLATNRPFRWTDAAEQGNRLHNRILHEAEDAGLRDGIGIPIHGPNNQCVGIGFASTRGKVDVKAAMPVLHLMAIQFHTAYSARTLPPPPPPPRLTPRECEILRWCAVGKSAWAIGEILNIAENSVEWHLKNIFRKLEVTSRIGAVLKALQFGIITL